MKDAIYTLKKFIKFYNNGDITGSMATSLYQDAKRALADMTTSTGATHATGVLRAHCEMIDGMTKKQKAEHAEEVDAIRDWLPEEEVDPS